MERNKLKAKQKLTWRDILHLPSLNALDSRFLNAALCHLLLKWAYGFALLLLHTTLLTPLQPYFVFVVFLQCSFIFLLKK